MRPIIVARGLAVLCLFEAAWLLIPWQSLVYGTAPFTDGNNLGIWMGAPLMYLGARMFWTGRARPSSAALFVFMNWVWLLSAFTLNNDPHGFGPRNTLLAIHVGWIPVVNSVLLPLTLAVGLMLHKA